MGVVTSGMYLFLVNAEGISLSDISVGWGLSSPRESRNTVT